MEDSMVFSSISFLYYFLPGVLLFYFLVSHKYRNIILFISSLFFYFYGEPRFIIVLLFSCGFSYIFGKWIFRCQVPWKRKVFLLFFLFGNFGILVYFKYFLLVIGILYFQICFLIFLLLCRLGLVFLLFNPQVM